MAEEERGQNFKKLEHGHFNIPHPGDFNFNMQH